MFDCVRLKARLISKYCVLLTSLKNRINFLFSALLVMMLAGCCGGGGGGGASLVTYDANRLGSPHSPLIWITDSEEFNAQKGLGVVQASAAYSRGFSGRDIRIAIVDSGIDSTHEEFGQRVFAGKDWHSESQGLIDPHGHGTHVAGIAAGARDDQGVHGIAPESHIYSYRILNEYGYFGGQQGAVMVPEIIQHSNQNQVKILNNSWASTTEINDVSKAVIISALGAELGAWETAVEEGQVMVWAAGNDRDSQVSVRAGLPHYFSHLRSGWLAVVAADTEGVEPSYTNRCGLAASWCITAPGGGDSAYYNGILSAQSGGGYVRKSGTSMAAPHVTGGLALLLDAFPSLTPQKAAKRLLQTASYDGLKTADGCTIELCSEAEMRLVFGQGQMDIQAALEPIGALSISDGALSYPLENSYLVASELLYAPLSDAVEEVVLSAKDSFDGADYTASLAQFILPVDVPKSFFSLEPFADVSAGFGKAKSRPDTLRLIQMENTYFSGFLETGKASPGFFAKRLTDMSAQHSELIAGFDMISGQKKEQPALLSVHAGYAATRQSMRATRRWQYGPAGFWLGGGIARHNHFLDSVASGGWQSEPSHEQWLFSGIQIGDANTAITAEWLYGQTKLKSEKGVLRAAHADLSAFSLHIDQLVSKRTRHRWSLAQPLYLEQASITLSPSALLGNTQHIITLPKQDRRLQAGWQLTHNLIPTIVISFGLAVSGKAELNPAIDDYFGQVAAHITF